LKSYYGVVEILDIMILVDDGVENVRELAESLHLKINEVISMPCDVLVQHESSFLERSALPTFERNIIKNGRVLYAA